MKEPLNTREVFDRLQLFPDLDVEISIKDVKNGKTARIKEVSCDDAGNIIVYVKEKEE